jgi:2-haloacid dehalogenase
MTPRGEAHDPASNMTARGIVLFDLNGTLTDPAPIGEPWDIAGLGHDVLTRALQTAMAETIVGEYHEFSAHLEEALTVELHLRRLDHERIDDALARAGQLPVFPEVPAALARLRDASWRLAVLTNSGAASGRRTLEAAGLADQFEQIVGVDAVRAFKPHPATYAEAMRTLDVRTDQVTFVASHPWDLAGAHRAGFRTILVARGQPRSKLLATSSAAVGAMDKLAEMLCR